MKRYRAHVWRIKTTILTCMLAYNKVDKEWPPPNRRTEKRLVPWSFVSYKSVVMNGEWYAKGTEHCIRQHWLTTCTKSQSVVMSRRKIGPEHSAWPRKRMANCVASRIQQTRWRIFRKNRKKAVIILDWNIKIHNLIQWWSTDRPSQDSDCSGS